MLAERVPILETSSTSPPTSLCWVAEHLYVGCRDGLIFVWSRGSRRNARRLEGHTGGVTSLAFLPSRDAGNDLGLLCSGSRDGTIRFWDTAACTCRVLSIHAGAVHQVRNVPARVGCLLYSCGADGTLRRANIRTLNLGVAIDGPVDSDGVQLVRSFGDEIVAFDCLTPYIVFVGLRQGRVAELDSWTGEVTRTFAGVSQQILALSVDPRAHRIVASADDGCLCVWDLADGALLHRKILSNGALLVATFAVDVRTEPWRARDLLLACKSGSVLRLADTALGECGPRKYDIVAEYPFSDAAVMAMCVDCNGDLWVAAADCHLRRLPPMRPCEFCEITCNSNTRSARVLEQQPRNCRSICCKCGEELGFGPGRAFGLCRLCCDGPIKKPERVQPILAKAPTPSLEPPPVAIMERQPVQVPEAVPDPPVKPAVPVVKMKRCGGGFVAVSGSQRPPSRGRDTEIIVSGALSARRNRPQSVSRSSVRRPATPRSKAAASSSSS